jgi:cyclopropane fatty-acyl-phospholipid synthase-like methyltransferase
MNYLNIADYYKQCLIEHGDSNLGVNWPNKSDVDVRHEVMLNILQKNETTTSMSLLDFGCGLGHFYEYIKNNNFIPLVSYTGIDINNEHIEMARKKHPNLNWIATDIHTDNTQIYEKYDYIICNGVFTVKHTLSHEQMWEFMTSTLEKLWTKTNKGIAFNVMSKLVDWERDDLFHVSMDELGLFLKNNLSRNFIIRNDYKLYEYTVYIYKN